MKFFLIITKAMHIVKPVMAITFNMQEILEDFLKKIKIERKSEPREFACIQNYYSREMGLNLKKIFLSLSGLVDALDLSYMKLWAIEMEKQYSFNGRRRLNIDVGYVDVGQMVLASSKKRGGRVAISEGIYAEIEYIYVYGSFRPLYWTYADYRDKEVIKFFETVRKDFLKQLKTAKNGDKIRFDALPKD